jgi:cell wall-associated NlpC family hydrolase
LTPIDDNVAMPLSYETPARLALAVAACCALVGAPAANAEKAKSPRTLMSSATEAASKAWSGAHDVAIYALGMIGVEYRYGGNTPESGLDCSGLVRYVFQEVTGVTLPRTSREMSGLGAKLKAEDLKAGDLVFFNTRGFQFSHVGIYLGDNRFIHAPSRGSEVAISKLTETYWQKHFNGARRLVGVLPSLVPNLITPAIASTPVAQPVEVPLVDVVHHTESAHTGQ